MNSVQLIGRITKDPEIFQDSKGEHKRCKFSVAIRRDANKSDFVNCLAWDKSAEILEKYVKKGDQLGIVGSILTGSYEKDGKRVYTTEVNVSRIDLLGIKQTATEEPKTSDFTPTEFAVIDEDIPF